MNSIDNADCWVSHGKAGAGLSITPQEEFVNGVYSALDEAIANGLCRLRSGGVVVPTCMRGCSHCCRNHIVTNVAEAHALAQYIKREFSIGQISGLRMRTKQWHEWNDYGPGRYPSADAGERADLIGYDHCCPLLVDDACSAYPARPVVCRTHYIRSNPRFCRDANDPESTAPPPVVITSVIKETSRFLATIRGYVENAGWDFSRSIMLLPHWLAIQMGWDFAITP